MKVAICADRAGRKLGLRDALRRCEGLSYREPYCRSISNLKYRTRRSEVKAGEYYAQSLR
jgi:hypothetical protein